MMVLKWLRRMRPSAMAAPVGMSARRGTASVSPLSPLWHRVGKSLLSKPTRIKRPRSVGALFVFKNMSILVKICAIIIYIYFPVYHLLCVVGVVILRGFFLLCIAALLCLWVYLCVCYGKRVTLFLNHTIARMFGKEEMKDEV